jgi:hypothetical protein
MTTKAQRVTLALAAAATFTITALGDVQAGGFMSHPVAVTRFATAPHFSGLKYAPPRFVGVLRHSPSGPQGNRGAPPNGSVSVNEGGNGQSGGGLDGWDGGGSISKCLSDRECHLPF